MATVTDLERAYFSAASGLTPAETFSLSDHQLAYYQTQTGKTGTLEDLRYLYFGAFTEYEFYQDALSLGAGYSLSDLKSLYYA